MAVDAKTQQVSMTLAEFRRVVTKQKEEAAAVKEDGNQLFKSGDVEGAEEKYHSALELADAILTVPATARPDFADLRRRVEATRVSALLNLAACSLKEKRYEDVEAFCLDVLKVNKKDVKALYRLGQAYLGLSRLEEAVESLVEAEKLDPANQDIEKMLRRARAEAKKADEREKKRFGGMFERSTYKGMRDLTLKAEEQAKQKERVLLVDTIKTHASATESALLGRWASSGMIALEDDERKTLTLLVRRLAAAGQLESSELRDDFKKHGLEAAFKVEKEELEEDHLKAYQEQQKLAEVKRITAKAQQRHQLTEEEQKYIRDYKMEEIDRLREKQRTEGITQDEQHLLRKLKESLEKEESYYQYYHNLDDKVGTALQKLNSGQHMGPRERYNLYKMLEDEEKRLEEMDDEVGLNTQQLKTLKALKKVRMDREEQRKGKKAHRDLVTLCED